MFESKRKIVAPSGLLVLCLSILMLQACADQITTGSDQDPSLTDHTLTSQHPPGEHTLSVWVPQSYATRTDHKYPVLFHIAFDTESLSLTRSVAEELSENGEIPEMLIVSLHHTGEHRQEDISPNIEGTRHQGQADRFLAHIEKEVIPFLETQYRISEDRILTGWSRFGFFTTLAFTKKPDLFSGFIVRSSALAGSGSSPLLLSELQSLLNRRTDLATTFHLSIGTEGGERRRGEAFDNLKSLLEQEAPSSLRWQTEKFEGAGHADTFPLGLRSGLLFYFSDGQPPSEL